MAVGLSEVMLNAAAADLDLNACPALTRSRQFSLNAVSAIRVALERSLGASGASILTVVAAGSLGRLEAAHHSDVDCIIIVDDTADRDPAGITCAVDAIYAEFSRAGLKPPKAEGIYCVPIKASTLLAPASRGSLDEPPAIFGSRMQLLLDARPLYCAEQFIALREQLLSWYRAPTSTSGSWTHLLNDLSRYLHAYAVWQQFKFSRSDDDGWYLRQAKMRSTRIATFAGLLFLLGESSRKRAEQHAWVLAQLDLTPLGRLKIVFDAHRDADFSSVIAVYESLHCMLSDGVIRRELIDSSPTTAADWHDDYPRAYARIHELSERLMDLLTQFVLARSNDWSRSIFRNWLL